MTEFTSAQFDEFKSEVAKDARFSSDYELPMLAPVQFKPDRAIAFWLQREGIAIVPNVRWGDERTYAFAFEGLPQGGTVAISANGLLRRKEDRKYFKPGLAVMVDVLQAARGHGLLS